MTTTTSDLQSLRKDVKELANPERAKHSQRFFKTGKGEYGEGDKFLGLTVPQQRKVAKTYKDLPLSDIETLLSSEYHEDRLTALFIMIGQFKSGDGAIQKELFESYMSHRQYVNNWDLVDSSTPYIVSMYLLDKPDRRSVLYDLARSNNLWDRRIAIMGTFAFITKGQEHKDTFAICEILLDDTEDLIHKATGWMLREVGKRISRQTEEKFLRLHYKKMPRTMLRYAIEHFPEKKRQQYLKGAV